METGTEQVQETTQHLQRDAQELINNGVNERGQDQVTSAAAGSSHPVPAGTKAVGPPETLAAIFLRLLVIQAQ
jgi:hypothetical protein